MYHCSNPTAHYQKIRSLAPYDKKRPLKNAAKFDSRHQCIISLSSGLLNSHFLRHVKGHKWKRVDVWGESSVASNERLLGEWQFTYVSLGKSNMGSGPNCHFLLWRDVLQCAECHLHCYLHVFLTSADKAYRQMKAMKESQSIIVSGKFISCMYFVEVWFAVLSIGDA